MTTYKQYIPDVWNNDIFNKNVTVYQKLKTDIGKVADGTDFAPAVSLDIQTQEIRNITTNEADATSAVNVEFLTEKVEEINVEIDDKVSSARKISVFKNASSVVVNETAPSVTTDLGVVLKDSRITTHDEANASFIEFAEAGLYRIDFSADVNGDYTSGFIEFVHETEDGVETTFRYLNLAESAIDCDTLTFNQLDKLKVKATVDENGKEYNIKFKLIIERLA